MLPTSGVTLTMVRAAEVRVTVQFPGPPVDHYWVSIAPVGEAVVGMHDLWVHLTRNPVPFTGVQPGRYIVRGRPESDQSWGVSVSVAIESGETSPVTLKAR